MRNMVSTFVPGLEGLVERALPQQVPGATVLRVMSGLIQYRLGGKGTLSEIPFVNNKFACLATFPKAKGNPVDMMVQRVCQFGGNEEALRLLPPKASSFRLVCMVQGELVSVPSRQMEAAENATTAAFGLVSNRARPDVEFWINYRKEGIGYFLLRVTRHGDFQKTLKRGELRPDLAALLCLLSGPSRNDRVLDPFCGRGAILRARTHWPSRSIMGGDRSDAVLQDAARIPGVQVRLWDAADLTEVADGSVDAVITDPPWGVFEKIEDLYGFYSKIMREMRRVVTGEGRGVFLLPRDKEVDRAVATLWRVVERYPVLVSGREAQVVLALPQ